MKSRREFLIALGASLLVAGCGGSGGDDKVVAPELSPEDKAEADKFKEEILKKTKKR